MNFVGIIILIGSIIGAMSLSSTLHYFLDLPSLLIVVGPVIGALISRHGFQGFKDLFSSDNKEVLTTIGVTALVSGVLGSIIGYVAMLANLTNTSMIGPSMAVSLLSSFYGLLTFIICFAVGKKLTFGAIAIFTPIVMLGACTTSFYAIFLHFAQTA